METLQVYIAKKDVLIIIKKDIASKNVWALDRNKQQVTSTVKSQSKT